MTDHYDERSDWQHIGFPLQILAKHLWLPNLRKVQVERILFTPYFEKAHHLLQGSSPIDVLRFLKCYASKSDRVVAAFLRSIKCLKRFVFETSSPSCQIAQTGPRTGVFELALSRHQETIEELAIANSEGSPMLGWRLGPFTQWSSFKRLAVPGYMILGVFPGIRNLHEILPPLLEEFQIQHPTGHSNRSLPQVAYGSSLDSVVQANYVPDMRRLAENKDFCAPRLNRVTWCYQRPTYSSEYPLDANLAGLIGIFLAFEKVGVKFEQVTEASFKDTPFSKRLYEWQE